MDLQGADIHDFLSCLGRHAITSATFGFNDSRCVERNSYDIVFVEDTDELAQAGFGGFGVTHKEEGTEATPGGWGGDGMQKEDNAGWGTESNHQETSEPTNSGRDEPMPSSTGWGMENNNEERKETMDSNAEWAVSNNDKQGGWGDEQVVVNDGGGWDSVGKSADKTAPASDEGAGWGSEQVTIGGDDWDMTKSKVAKTDNSNTKGASKGGFMHPSRKNNTDLTDTGADERRSGKFAPSGSNVVPLGKRRFGTKLGLSHNEPESTMLKDTQIFQDKEEQMGWGMSKKTTTEDDFCWSNTLQEKRGAHRNIEEKELGRDEWMSSTDWGNVSTGQTDQRLTNDGDQKGNWNSPPEGEALAGWGADPKEQGKDIRLAHEGEWGKMPAVQAEQETKSEIIRNGDWSVQPDSEIAPSSSHGWGLEMKIDNNNGGVHGWDDMQSDAPAINKVRKSIPTNWGSGSIEPLPWKRDGTPFPRKKFNKGSTEGSWTAFGSNSPQPQSRRPRIRALLNLPEYSELDKLYKATNKILHHSDYQPGDKLKPEDEKFILDKILVHHPDKEVKVGCGVDHIMIDSHGEHQVSCFWVVHKDESKTDFSYWKCLEGLLQTKYPDNATKELGKEEAKDSWKSGVSSIAPAKNVCGKDKTQDCWTTWPSSTADQEEAKDSWKTGAMVVAPKGSISDQASWGVGATSLAPAKTASYQQGAEVDTPNEILGEVKGGWETWTTTLDSTTNMRNQDETKNSGWEM